MPLRVMRRPKPEGISAVGWVAPVAKKARSPSMIRSRPIRMVVEDMGEAYLKKENLKPETCSHPEVAQQ